MTGILDSLTSMLTPDVSSRLASSFGIDQGTVQKGMGLVGPVVLGGLARRASTPAGLTNLMDNLPTNVTPDFFKSLVGSAGGLLGGTGGGQGGLMTALLGSGTNAIGSSLSQRLGFDVRPLLSFAVPAVGGIIAKFVSEQKPSATGLASLLQRESTDYLADPANAENAKIVKAALEAGERSEALRRSFAETEWTKVRRAPVAAMYVVAAASPSGPVGLSKEFSAAAEAMTLAGKAASPTSLVANAFGGGVEKEDFETLQKEKPDSERLLAEIHDAYVVVSEKGAPEAAGFREFVMKVAQSTAEATKEGGFLGIGGVRVTAEEKQAIDRIRTALN
jgi:Bacterial protein of unknown function (DUF937)